MPSGCSAHPVLTSPFMNHKSPGSPVLLTVSPALLSASVSLASLLAHNCCAPTTEAIFAIPPVLYGFSIAYLVGPVIGVPVDSAHIIDLAHQLPEWAKVSAKTLLAAPFAFHSLNGIRHLAWDSTKRKHLCLRRLRCHTTETALALQ